MTIPKNFPGRKHQRRISALKRLLESGRGNSEDSTVKKEISVLESRIAKGGKKSTKKVGTNTGRRMS